MNDSPIAAMAVLLFVMLMLSVFFMSAGLWISSAIWLFTGRRMLPVESRIVAPFGLVDIVIAFFLMMLFGTIIGVPAIRMAKSLVGATSKVAISDISKSSTEDSKQGEEVATPPEVQAVVMVVQGVSQILAMICASFVISLRSGIPLSKLGWSLGRIKYDLALGLVAALLFIPVVQCLMVFLGMLLDTPYDHPLYEAFKNGPQLLIYFVAFFVAVLAAPITEEFLFRVVLQGFLESMSLRMPTFSELIFGRLDPRAVPLTSTSTPTQAAFVPAADGMVTGLGELKSDLPSISLSPIPLAQGDEASFNPFSPPSTRDVEGSEAVMRALPVASQRTLGDWMTAAEQKLPENAARVPIWPCLLSGTLFGLAHFEYGVSWIPLIVLGIILGFLYRSTQRIWAPTTVHVLLNSIAMGGLAVQLISGMPLNKEKKEKPASTAVKVVDRSAIKR